MIIFSSLVEDVHFKLLVNFVFWWYSLLICISLIPLKKIYNPNNKNAFKNNSYGSILYTFFFCSEWHSLKIVDNASWNNGCSYVIYDFTIFIMYLD